MRMGYFLFKGKSIIFLSSDSSLLSTEYEDTALSMISNVYRIFLAIYYDTFYDADPVKQERNIFDVFARVFRRE